MHLYSNLFQSFKWLSVKLLSIYSLSIGKEKNQLPKEIKVRLNIHQLRLRLESPAQRTLVTIKSYWNEHSAINAAKPGKISIWRTIFAANEWSEIQVVRKTSVEFQLFATIFLLEVVGFEKFTCTTPSNSAAFTYNCNDENKRNAFTHVYIQC